MKRFVGVVCGLRSEAAVAARCAAKDDVRIAVSGANAARAEALAAQLCRDDAQAIVSYGVSGALAPHLKPGDVLIGASVVTERGEIFACDEALSFTLRAALSKADHPGSGPDPGISPQPSGRLPGEVLLGADTIIASREDKARLYRETGAVAVDMESHGAARAAKAAGVPFLAIRAIADPADRALPKAALGAVAPDGSTRILATLLNCVKAPGDFPALLQLGKDSDAALNALSRLGGLFRGLFLGLDL